MAFCSKQPCCCCLLQVRIRSCGSFPAGGTGWGISRQTSILSAEFWVSDESPENGNFSPETLGGGTVRMIITVDDPDSMFSGALKAGAKEISPVIEEHGWRSGRLADPFGHHWEIGRPL